MSARTVPRFLLPCQRRRVLAIHAHTERVIERIHRQAEDEAWAHRAPDVVAAMIHAEKRRRGDTRLLRDLRLLPAAAAPLQLVQGQA